MNYYIILLIFASVLILFFMTMETYSMTLGGYGQPEPKECSEHIPGLRYKNLYSCKACGLECSTKESKENCVRCMQILNDKYDGIL